MSSVCSKTFSILQIICEKENVGAGWHPSGPERRVFIHFLVPFVGVIKYTQLEYNVKLYYRVIQKNGHFFSDDRSF